MISYENINDPEWQADQEAKGLDFLEREAEGMNFGFPQTHRVGSPFPAPNDRSLPGMNPTPAAEDAHRKIGGGGNDFLSTESGSATPRTDDVAGVGTETDAQRRGEPALEELDLSRPAIVRYDSAGLLTSPQLPWQVQIGSRFLWKQTITEACDLAQSHNLRRIDEAIVKFQLVLADWRAVREMKDADPQRRAQTAALAKRAREILGPDAASTLEEDSGQWADLTTLTFKLVERPFISPDSAMRAAVIALLGES